MIIPMIIIDNPIAFLNVIFSFKNSQLSTATNMYPADSSIGPKDSGITVYAQIEHRVAPKNIM